jgi:hypothetical protein
MYVHALHTVHALPDLRIAAGRLRDDVSFLISKKLFDRTLSIVAMTAGSDSRLGLVFGYQNRQTH